MSKILYNSLICILWKKNMSDNPKDTSENPRNIPENSKNIIDELKEFYKKISPIVKLTSLVVSAFSIIISFTFTMTYMRNNDFFSYEIFSLNGMWMFFIAFLYLFIIIFAFYGFLMVYIYFGFNELSDIGNVRKKNVKRFGTFCLCKKHIIILPERIQCNIGHTRFIRYFSCAYTLILETVFSCLACKSGNALFCLMVKIYVGSTPLIIFLALIVFLINASKPQMIFLLGGFFLLLLYLYLIMYDRGGMITEIYKIFFKSRGLASDHAEIYLKDKNESVISGKLIFDDGKYAYVEFDRTYSNCIGVGDSCIKTIRKKVPSEDVSIITKVKKDTKASVPK